MSSAESARLAPIRLRRYTWALAVCWTATIGVTLMWELRDEQNQAVSIALSAARGAWEREAAVRRWDAAQGGVYIPLSETTLPDPHLAQLPERDITTPSGRKLTLLNPAAIIRSIQQATQKDVGNRSPSLSAAQSGRAVRPGAGGSGIGSKVRGHITSLRPLDARNAPDAWEKAALEACEAGEEEVHALLTMDGDRYLRLMRPLMIEESCLKCHVEQGYKLGEIRGGISVSVPIALVWPAQLQEILHRIMGYGGMWLLGLTGIFTLSRQLRRQVEYRYQAERKLQETNAMLEQRVAQRTAELATVNKELENEIAERKHAEQWLLESEQRFRGYFEQGLVGMAILSANQEWVEVNPRLCRLLGHSEEELIGKVWTELTHAEDRAAEEAHVQRLLAGGAAGEPLEMRLLRKNGQVLRARVTMQCMRKEDGKVDSILVLVHEGGRR